MPPSTPDRAQEVQSSATPSIVSGQPSGDVARFENLRGVRWRMHLGILPSSSDATIVDLRRVTADSRRRYAILRRRLIIDPHIYKDGSRPPALVVDNPLSQDPDSMWSRFFQSAELERVVDQDLSRLYPEEGSYFQTQICQAMLRKILLLWCLRHPGYGYRQGMHELLAPLLYVLNMDVQRLSEVRKLHEDQFNDEFDRRSFSENDAVSNYGYGRSTSWDDENVLDGFQAAMDRDSSLVDLDPETRDIILLSDAYGAEGELGIVLSERFMEHDAYCMFDALMNGTYGMVAIADFFSLSPTSQSSTGLTPVIEASSALYHLLSVVDPPLHSHLVELGVEPQYFGLRWLRVLFGREFPLKRLLVIWDEVFSASNGVFKVMAENEAQSNFRILCSPRGAFISAMAVSMILHLRSSLLATENATTCLQRLLNFPENINVKSLIDKAKSMQSLAVEINVTTHSMYNSVKSVSALTGSYGDSSGSVPPENYTYSLPESYWEEKWRVLHKTEEPRNGIPFLTGTSSKSSSNRKFSLLRRELDHSHAGIVREKRNISSSIKRRLFDDLPRADNSEACDANVEHGRLINSSDSHDTLIAEGGRRNNCQETSPAEENYLSCVGLETSFSEDNSPLFSHATSPLILIHDQENDSEKSSATSNSCPGDDEREVNLAQNLHDNSNNIFSGHLGTSSADIVNPGPAMDVSDKKEIVEREKKPSSNRFQWLWKFSRGMNEGNVDKVNVEAHRKTGHVQKDISCSSLAGYASTGRPEAGDKKLMGTLKNLGQTMLENIQVLESIFQQDRSQVGSLDNLSNNILGGKGQATAMAALKELRKINNLLFEM